MADFKDDLDILNYALTLEHLESNLYRQIVASGRLTGDEQRYATDFNAIEAAHIQALSQTIQKLGGTPVAAAAKYNFPALDMRDHIVNFLVTVEEIGAGAYLAALPEIQDPDVLTATVQIHNIEGEHASIWRRQAKMMPVAGAFASPIARGDVLKVVAPIIGAAGGGAAAATPVTGTSSGTAATAPVAAGTGDGSTSTSTTPITLPQTGAPKGEMNTGPTAAVIGAAAVGIGVALRARSYKRAPKPAVNGN